MPASVPVTELRGGLSPRSTRVDLDHASRLAQAWDDLPPILVHGESMRIVDGEHRKAAAKQLGLSHVDVEWFDGDETAARDEATRRNVAHGLPLTAVDRKREASRMLASHPDWSNRQIADHCGISDKTVADLRPTSESPQLDKRHGADGKQRPVNPAPAREEAARIICENPAAPLREVAEQVGLSPETVRDVKHRVERGDDPVPPRLRPVPAPDPEPAVGDIVTAIPDWRSAPEFQTGSAAAEFGAWMHARTRWPGMPAFAGDVDFAACPPQHRDIAAKQLRRIASYYEAAAQRLSEPQQLRRVR